MIFSSIYSQIFFCLSWVNVVFKRFIDGAVFDVLSARTGFFSPQEVGQILVLAPSSQLL